MNFILECKKRPGDGVYVILVKGTHSEFGKGDSEKEAWEMAMRNAEYMKKEADKEVAKANTLIQEIHDAIQHCWG